MSLTKSNYHGPIGASLRLKIFHSSLCGRCQTIYQWTCGVCTWSCFYQRCCQVRAVRESSYENGCCSPSVVCTHSATCAAEPTTPSVTRSQNGPALNGPVAVGVNETTSIWCRARTGVVFMLTKTVTLRGLFWQYSNNTRLPAVENGESSDFDVYAEPYTGRIVTRADTWLRALHFRKAQPSSAGNYTCVADYYHRSSTNYQNFSQSVEIRVTGG